MIAPPQHAQLRLAHRGEDTAVCLAPPEPTQDLPPGTIALFPNGTENKPLDPRVLEELTARGSVFANQGRRGGLLG